MIPDILFILMWLFAPVIWIIFKIFLETNSWMSFATIIKRQLLLRGLTNWI